MSSVDLGEIPSGHHYVDFKIDGVAYQLAISKDSKERNNGGYFNLLGKGGSTIFCDYYENDESYGIPHYVVNDKVISNV